MSIAYDYKAINLALRKLAGREPSGVRYESLGGPREEAPRRVTLQDIMDAANGFFEHDLRRREDATKAVNRWLADAHAQRAALKQMEPAFWVDSEPPTWSWSEPLEMSPCRIFSRELTADEIRRLAEDPGCQID